MKRIWSALCVLLFLSAGCAYAPPQADVTPEDAAKAEEAALAASGMPPLKAGTGRLVLFRSPYFGPLPDMKQPSPVMVDAGIAGTSVPGSFFYLDLPPGAHEVALAAPGPDGKCARVAGSHTYATVAGGQVTFVRIVGAWSLKRTVLKPAVAPADAGWKAVGELKLRQPDCAKNPQAHCRCGG